MSTSTFAWADTMRTWDRLAPVGLRLQTVRLDAMPCVSERSNPIGTTADALAALRPIFAGLDSGVEHFVLLALDGKGRVSGFKHLTTGGQTQTHVPPKEVFLSALALRAVSIVLAHNHPSGDPEPSRDDIDVTARIVSCGTLLGITVADHLVLGTGGSFVSLAQRGYI